MGVAVPSPLLQAAAAHLPRGLVPCSALPLRSLTFARPGSHRPGECRGPTGLSARSPERKGLTTDDPKSLGRAGRTPLAPYPPCPPEDPGPARAPLGPARNEAGSTFSFPGPRGRPRLQRRHPTVQRGHPAAQVPRVLRRHLPPRAGSPLPGRRAQKPQQGGTTAGPLARVKSRYWEKSRFSSDPEPYLRSIT